MSDSIKFPPVEKTQATDTEGHSCRLYSISGTDIYLPPFPNFAARFQELPELVAREDDIVICGYPKCGTHWLWEKIGMLLQEKADYISSGKETLMIEIADNATLDALLTSPRILNTHLPPEFLPPQFFEKKSKIIYILRNPKDMAVSLYNHTFNLLPVYGYDGKWSGYFELFMNGKVEYGNWFRYVLGWEEFISSRPDLPIHVINFEDMKKDSASEISKLASFLGLVNHTDLHEDIADKCSFKKMKEAKDKLDHVEYWREKKPLMYRKGEVGDWKNWFTVDQNERFDDMLKDKMSSSKLQFTYEL